jgi:putative transposase
MLKGDTGRQKFNRALDIMSRKYKFHDNDKLYFISYAVVYCIDVFIRDEYKQELINSWQHCMENKGLQIYSWCIMTSHVHLIIGTVGQKKLDEIVGETKSYTSTRLKKIISDHPQESRKEWMMWMFERAGKKNSNNNDWQFWQQHNKPLEIKDQEMFDNTLNYIHDNPVVAGFVNKPEDWIYSSARDFCGVKGLVELSFS